MPRLLTIAAVLSLALPAAASAATAEEMTAELVANDTELRGAIDTWRSAAGDPPASQAPAEVIAPALLLQRRVRFLSKRPRLAAAVTEPLAEPLEGRVQTMVEAAAKLRRLAGKGKRRNLRVGKPETLASLVSHYDEADALFGIEASYLAAINLVETKFGRVKSNSTAGARGPMQFIPSTWRIYGEGGDIRDPHDAILAAARLLRDRGAPRSYARALYAYNPSKLYVGAVTDFAKLIARDSYVLPALYCWGP